MKYSFSVTISLGLLLSACGVSSSDQQKMSDDFRNKFTALYLAPEAPGMVEDVEVYDFEKGGGLVDGAFRAKFSATHVGDGGRSRIHGVVGFGDDRRVAFRDSVHLSVFIIMVTDMVPARSVPSAEWGDYLPSQIPY